MWKYVNINDISQEALDREEYIVDVVCGPYSTIGITSEDLVYHRGSSELQIDEDVIVEETFHP